jgi:WhiB family redox-sensing transcriptional regulator
MYQPSWFDHAVCMGKTDLFYSHYNERPSARHRRELKAIAICNTCPVQEQCRKHGRDNAEYGIWGGETEEQRADLGYLPIRIRKPRILSQD